MAGKYISYEDQCKSLTLVRSDQPDELGQLNVAAARGALQRVNRAFAAFFRRCKTGEKPGYPRFRSRRRYHTIEVNDVHAGQVRNVGPLTVIRINGLPAIRLRPHRALPADKPRAIRITRRTCGCTVDLVYEHQPEEREDTGESIGVDLGVRKRLTLSSGETIEPEHEDQKPIRRAQRAVARSKKRSNRREKRVRHLARLRRRTAVRRRNACHQITSGLIRRFDTIAVEDLRIGNMTRAAKGTTAAPGRNVRAKASLNRSILEQSWGAILDQLVYKAAWAGRRVVTVRAAFTSQDCSACGKRRTKPDGRERWQCENCHKEHDRDVNAAINIHRAGMRALGSKSSGRAAARAGNTA